MLRSADLCNALYLRDACVSYIVDHFKAVVITEECVKTSCCAAHEKHCAVSVPCLSNLPICFAASHVLLQILSAAVGTYAVSAGACRCIIAGVR